MGYSRGEAEIIGEAALYHDIGKCFIPPELLDRPGALTQQEFEIVKGHTRLGSEKLQEAQRVLSAAYRIAKYHHERWDGSGYLGLTGRNIDPYARLAAVADVYDALASKRAYKDALKAQEVLGYLKKYSGIQFDKDVVSALLAHAGEIAALYR